jgi:hypothetical protein
MQPYRKSIKPQSKIPPPIEVSNVFSDLVPSPDPREQQDEYDELLREQDAQMSDFRRKELQIEAENAARDQKQQTIKSDEDEEVRPIIKPFRASRDKVRQYGLIREKDASDIETSIFQRLRTSMFKTGKGGMFMFGTPDTMVLSLLVRLYNENVVRIAKNIPPESSSPSISVMLGVVNSAGNIYITLSEDPREDDDYYRKTRLIYTLLTYTNCNVIYDEEDALVSGVDPDVTSVFGSKRQLLFPKLPFVYRDLKRKPTACLSSAEHGNTNRALIRDTWNGKGNESYDFDKAIIDSRIDVHFIHSLKYLVGRRPENPDTQNIMFPPVKKAAGSGRTGFHECANGSTCSEAKIFSYIHQQFHVLPTVVSGRRKQKTLHSRTTTPTDTFRQITGYAAYWIPAKNPPDHILTNYNYTYKHNDKYETESNEIIGIVRQRVPSFIAQNVNDVQFKYFAQLFALPCPGCFLNYQNYVTNNMVPYDLSTCVKTRKGRLYEGGKRSRQNKTLRRKKLNHKYKYKHTRKCRCRTCRGTKRTRK